RAPAGRLARPTSLAPCLREKTVLPLADRVAAQEGRAPARRGGARAARRDGTDSARDAGGLMRSSAAAGHSRPPGGAARLRRRLPIGAEPIGNGRTHFRVWAPRAPHVDVVLASRATPLDPEAHGYFSKLIRAD